MQNYASFLDESSWVSGNHLDRRQTSAQLQSRCWFFGISGKHRHRYQLNSRVNHLFSYGRLCPLWVVVYPSHRRQLNSGIDLRGEIVSGIERGGVKYLISLGGLCSSPLPCWYSVFVRHQFSSGTSLEVDCYPVVARFLRSCRQHGFGLKEPVYVWH